MAQTNVRALDSQNVFGAPLDDGIVVAAGDVVYYDNVTDNEFKIADPTGVLAYATYIATHGQTGDGTNGKRLMCVKAAEIYDEDGPFTAGSAIYLADSTSGNLISDAARNLTHTAPTTVSDVIQKVGEAISTKRAIVDLRSSGREVEVVAQEALLEGGGARLLLDTGPASGVVMAAAGDDASWYVPIPENAVSIVRARVQYSANVTLDATDTVSWSIASADVGETNDVVTDSIATAGEAVTADELGEIDLSGGLNAASLVKPGGSLWIKVTKVAEGSAGDDHVFFTPVVTFKVV